MKVLLLDNHGRKLGKVDYTPGHNGAFPSNKSNEQGKGIYYEHATCEWEGQAYEVTIRWDMSDQPDVERDEDYDWSEPEYMVLEDLVDG